MGKSKSIIAVFIIIVLAAPLILAGCGGEEATPATTKKETPIIAPPTQEKKTLDNTILERMTPLEQQLIQKLIEDEAEDTTEYPDTIENQILVRYLTSSEYVSYFTYIGSEAGMWGIEYDLDEWRARIKSDLNTGVNIDWYDFSNLVDKLFDVNTNHPPLTIKSCIPEGYFVIDYETYINFLEVVSKDVYERGSGWREFEFYNFPHFQVVLTVSLPAYDPETGFALLYVNYTYKAGPTYGHSWPTIILMEYKDGLFKHVYFHQLGSAQISYFEIEPDFNE